MINPFDPPCAKCGHEPESTLKTLIFAAAMREDIRKDTSLYAQLDTDLAAISSELHKEVRKEGTQHRYADKTLSELREIYA